MDNYNNGNQGFELDWGSEIENDSPDFIVLPEGEYDFTVKSFERGRLQWRAIKLARARRRCSR